MTMTPADRVAAIARHTPITAAHRAAATALLEGILEVAAEDGFTLDDFDWVADLPGACLDVILAKSRR